MSARIVSFEPFLTDCLLAWGAGARLVGVSCACSIPDTEKALIQNPPLKITKRTPSLFEPGVKLLARYGSDFSFVSELLPDVIALSLPAKDDEESAALCRAAETQILNVSDRTVRVVNVSPLSLDGMITQLEALGRATGLEAQAHSSCQKIKAQCSSWADNFYDRTKHKKITVLSSIEPLLLAGRWIPDLIALTTGTSQAPKAVPGHIAVTWDKITQFRPDVILVAPEGASLEQSMRYFKVLEKLPGWEEIPAVKRGEVVFTGGEHHIYKPARGLTDSFGVIISAIAGFDSGYITERDSFQRLRWLELQRHRL